MTKTSLAVARELLRIGAVTLRPEQPFTWASGRLSPVYTDNRLTLGYPEVRRLLTDAFAELAAPFRAEVIAGTATAGIPHAAWLAERLSLPMVYVRSAAKEHGTRSRIEGPVCAKQRVLIIEDLVSTGGSAISAAEALRDVGADIVGVLAVFTYGFPESGDALANNGLPFRALTDFNSLTEVAESDGLLSVEALEALRSWHSHPEGWSPSGT